MPYLRQEELDALLSAGLERSQIMRFLVEIRDALDKGYSIEQIKKAITEHFDA